jgi:MscS family membrane protein
MCGVVRKYSINLFTKELTMRYMKLLLLPVIILFLLSQIYAQNTVKKVVESVTDREKKGGGDKIVILPFYDYTDSSMKYLSTYIPELIKDRLTLAEGVEIYGPKMIREEIESRKLSPRDLYDREVSLAFLREINATIGLMGRYVIVAKTIRIDYHIVYVKTGKIIKGQTFEGVVDDTLMGTVDRFADISSEWFEIEALSEVVTKLEKKKKTKFREIFQGIKESRIGIIFTNKWLFSLCILISFYILAKLMVLFFEKILKRLTTRTGTKLDDDLITASKKPLKWIIIVIGIKMALLPLKMDATTALFFNNVTTAFIIAFITYIVFRTLGILIHYWGSKVSERIDSRIDDDLVPLFVKITNIFIIIMGALLILSRFGVEIGPLVASLGIAGFAIGFAVKDSLANIIGGIILILDKSFAVGDKVTVDDDTGIIKEVGLRNTKLLTFDNEIIVIPNGELMNKKFKNYVLPDPTIRVVVDFGVAYGTDVDRVEEVVMNVIHAIEDVVEEPPPSVVFYEMADFSLNFQAKFWIPLYENQYAKKIEATKKIYNALQENKITIPFPTHTVYLERE